MCLVLYLKARGNGEAEWSSEDGMDVGVSQTWVEELALNRACFLPCLSNRFLVWQVGGWGDHLSPRWLSGAGCAVLRRGTPHAGLSRGKFASGDDLSPSVARP